MSAAILVHPDGTIEHIQLPQDVVQYQRASFRALKAAISDPTYVEPDYVMYHRIAYSFRDVPILCARGYTARIVEYTQIVRKQDNTDDVCKRLWKQADELIGTATILDRQQGEMSLTPHEAELCPADYFHKLCVRAIIVMPEGA